MAISNQMQRVIEPLGLYAGHDNGGTDKPMRTFVRNGLLRLSVYTELTEHGGLIPVSTLSEYLSAHNLEYLATAHDETSVARRMSRKFPFHSSAELPFHSNPWIVLNHILNLNVNVGKGLEYFDIGGMHCRSPMNGLPVGHLDICNIVIVKRRGFIRMVVVVGRHPLHGYLLRCICGHNLFSFPASC